MKYDLVAACHELPPPLALLEKAITSLLERLYIASAQYNLLLVSLERTVYLKELRNAGTVHVKSPLDIPHNQIQRCPRKNHLIFFRRSSRLVA